MSRPTELFEAVPRSKVYTSIVEQIMNKVRGGVFPPGTRLPSERILADQLDVSRTSLREAIRVLEHADVLDVRGGSGTYVTEESLSESTVLRAKTALIGEHSPLDLVAARQAVEPLCAELAAMWRHAKDLTSMEENLASHEEALNTDVDPAAADAAFHLTVARAAHNDVLNDIERYFVDLMSQRTWSELKHRSRKKTGEQFLKHHRAAYKAIRDADAVAARRVMSEHMDAVHQALLAEAEEPS